MPWSPVHVWTVVWPQPERETCALFQKYDDKDWSYTDCALLALAEHLKLNQVFAFDEDFDQMPGLTRYP
jgi:predicted nucleic acid-binding protein